MKLLIPLAVLCVAQCSGMGELIGYTAQTGNYRMNRFPLDYYKKLLAGQVPPPAMYPTPLDGREDRNYGNGYFAGDSRIAPDQPFRMRIQSQNVKGRYYNVPVNSNSEGQSNLPISDDDLAEFLEERRSRDTSEWGVFPNTSHTLPPPCWPLDTRPQCVGYGR